MQCHLLYRQANRVLRNWLVKDSYLHSCIYDEGFPLSGICTSDEKYKLKAGAPADSINFSYSSVSIRKLITRLYRPCLPQCQDEMLCLFHSTHMISTIYTFPRLLISTFLNSSNFSYSLVSVRNLIIRLYVYNMFPSMPSRGIEYKEIC